MWYGVLSSRVVRCRVMPGRVVWGCFDFHRLASRGCLLKAVRAEVSSRAPSRDRADLRSRHCCLVHGLSLPEAQRVVSFAYRLEGTHSMKGRCCEGTRQELLGPDAGRACGWAWPMWQAPPFFILQTLLLLRLEAAWARIVLRACAVNAANDARLLCSTDRAVGEGLGSLIDRPILRPSERGSHPWWQNGFPLSIGLVLDRASRTRLLAPLSMPSESGDKVGIRPLCVDRIVFGMAAERRSHSLSGR